MHTESRLCDDVVFQQLINTKASTFGLVQSIPQLKSPRFYGILCDTDLRNVQRFIFDLDLNKRKQQIETDQAHTVEIEIGCGDSVFKLLCR